jgi:hypothetical protein
VAPMAAAAPPACGAIRALILVVLAAGVGLRLLHLDADPDYYAWVGYVTDEGRWIAHAREMALFGHLVNTDWLIHLLLAPLFQAASFVVFTLLGVSIWTSRLLAAVSGGAILVLFWLGLRRLVAPPAMLVALALLAFEVDLLMLSRVAVPEVPAMLLQLAVFLLVATGPPTSARLLGAGLLLLAMIGTKATTVFLLPIFSAIVLLAPPPEGARRRWSSLLLFLAGPLVSLVLGGGALALAGRARPSLVANLGIIRSFLGLNGPYTVLAFPFETDFGPVFNMWALGLCLVAVAWLARRDAPVEPALRRAFIAASVWIALYTVLMVSLAYFPDRYRVHVLVPMAIALATGITVASRVSRESIAAVLRARGLRGLASGVLLGLPTAALWAPIPAGLGSLIGVDATRLRLKLLCLAVALAATTWLVRRVAPSRPTLLRALVGYPIVGVLAWLVGQRTGLLDPSFWPAPGAGPRSWWVTGPWAAALLTAALAGAGRAWRPERWAALVPAAALCYGGLVVARVAPSYLHPHYTLKETSAALGATLAGGPDVLTVSRGEGLFTGNRLPYRSTLGRTWPAREPERIVIVFRFDDPEDRLGRDYTLTATYRLFVSPEYEDEHSATLDTVNHQEFVKVYVRRAG